ncbi:MAG: hypothetical protein JWP97_2144 [Labilithrix sp.]|nr:hypothetical protein [Labilithrix sp.]
MWRPEDEALLRRLEDEVALERLFRHHVGSYAETSGLPHPRAAGLAAAARQLEGGTAAVEAAAVGDATKLARLLEAAPLKDRPPALLHHLALYQAKVARALEGGAPEAAANAWWRAIAAWLALGEEHAYIARLEESVLGPGASSGARGRPLLVPPEDLALELLADLGRRAEKAARELAASGRAALLALAWVGQAAQLAGVGKATTDRALAAAERHRNAALDGALAIVGEALDEANARGELATAVRALLVRALHVWAWSGQDEAVEQFAIDRLATAGWQLYRARAWDALRQLFDPFRTLIDSMARRVEQDPSRIAFAAPCAQMFVFLTDVETHPARKRELAERAVKLCPSHRNGRLNLAALLCDEALTLLRSMVLFARRDQLARVEALLARAEALYPASSELPEAKAMLERVRRGRIAI